MTMRRTSPQIPTNTGRDTDTPGDHAVAGLARLTTETGTQTTTGTDDCIIISMSLSNTAPTFFLFRSLWRVIV